MAQAAIFMVDAVVPASCTCETGVTFAENAKQFDGGVGGL
jgi:hypothetical protein